MKRLILLFTIISGFIINVYTQETIETNSDENNYSITLIPNQAQFNLCDVIAAAINEPLPSDATVTWTVSDQFRVITGQGNIVQLKCRNIGEGTITANIITGNTDTIKVSKNVSILPPTPSIPDFASTRSMTISNDFTLTGTFIVKKYHEITIKSKVSCTPNAKFFVERGAILILDGTVLTSACPTELWQGIELEGSSAHAQNPTHGGIVEFKNNSVIENAITGIKTVDDVSPETLGGNGIIFAENSTFRNNLVSIHFRPYGVSFQPINISYIKNCTFILNDNNNFSYDNFIRGEINAIILEEVNVQNIFGCEFINSMSNSVERDYTRAIDVYLSVFGINGYCSEEHNECETCTGDYKRSRFEGFPCAIGTGYGFMNGSFIKNTDFIGNNTGVSLLNQQYAKIHNCNFKIPPDGRGISLEAGTYGYNIEGNNFNTVDPLQNINTRGINIYSAINSENVIYRNSFKNLEIAINNMANNGGLQSNDPGLQFICNDFSNISLRDIRNTDKIRPVQGGFEKGADNLFSSDAQYNLLSDEQSVFYIHSQGNRHAPLRVTNNVSVWPFAEPNGCPDLTCPQQANAVDHSADIENYRKINEVYKAKMNEFEIADYNNVLEEYKTGKTVMDPTVSQALKLLMEISSLSMEMTEISNRNIRSILDQETRDLDKLREWFKVMDNLPAKYSLVHSYWTTDDYAGAAGVLNELPQKIKMNDEEFENYLNYIDMNNFKEKIFLSGRTMAQLDSTEIEELKGIAVRTNLCSASAAKGALCFYYKICYSEEEPKAETYREPPYTGTINSTGAEGLFVFPNPAKDKLLVKYEPELIKNIKVLNLTGIVEKEFPEINNNEKEIDIKHLPAGLYIIEITTENQILNRKIFKE